MELTQQDKDLLSAGKLLTDVCHAAASSWWIDLETGQDLRAENNIPEKLMLIVSEIAEAMEGHRKGIPDDKLPNRPMVEVELADAVIRIFDLAGAKNFDIAGAIVEKLKFNATCNDHKPESRKQLGANHTNGGKNGINGAR